MNLKPIPENIDPPNMSPAVVAEITDIIFGKPETVQPCDIIFIFGGSHPGLWENGAKAYADGLGKDVIVTGGYKPDALRHPSWKDGARPEAEVIWRELIRLGVPERNVFIEAKSTNTYENVKFALVVYDFTSVTSILAVCKSYAVGRQLRTLQAQVNAGVKLIPFPFDTHLGGDGPFITRDNWSTYKEARAYMFVNVLKIYQYGQAGHLAPLTRMSPELSQMVMDYFAS